MVALALAGCAGGEGGGGGDEESAIAARLAALPPVPAEHRVGADAYVRHCASCHGPSLGGTTTGPPLAHRIYEPSHHGDASFLLATRNGVAAHHWPFGDMPPQPQVAEAEVAAITSYVRWVQRQVGIK